MQLLKQSTSASLVVGPVLDSTGLEYASAVIGDISLSKNGGTLTALASAATLTYIANGHYTLALTTGNTDTLGRADILCNKAGYQLPPVRLTVLAATAFDTLVTNGTLASTTSGRTLDVSAGGEAGIDWANVGSPTTTLALTGTTIATTQKVDLETIKTNPVVNAGTVTFPTTATLASTTNITAGTITTVGTLTTYTGNTPQTGDAYALANSGTFGLAAIKGYVDDIGIAGAGLTALGDTRLANLDAAVSSRMATYTQPTGFLAATFPATLASTTNITAGTITTVGSVTGAVGSVTGNVGGMTAAGWATAFTVDTTKAFADAVEGSLVKEVADGVASGGGTVDANVVSVNGNTFAGSNVPTVLADGVAHGGTPGSSTATLALAHLNVTASAGLDAVFLAGDAFGNGVTVNAGADGTGAVISGGGTSGNGVEITCNSGDGLAVTGRGSGSAAIRLVGDSDADGFSSEATAPGLAVNLHGSGLDANMVQIMGDGLDDNNATLKLRCLDLFNDGEGGAAFRVAGYNADDNSAPFRVENTSDGAGLLVLGGNGGPGMLALGGNGGAALQLGDGTNGTEGLRVIGGGTESAVKLESADVAPALVVVNSGGTAVRFESTGGDGDGLSAVGNGTGAGFHSTPEAVGFGGGTTFPANFSALVIDADGRVLTDRVMLSGTLNSQSLGDVNNIVLPTGPTDNGVLVSSRIRIYSGAGQYQERTITSWDGTNKIATLNYSLAGVAQAPGDLFHVLYDNSPQIDTNGTIAANAHVSTIGPTALGQFFSLNSGQVFADAVAGSVVKEIADNASGVDLSTDLAAVKAKTDNLPASPAAVGSAMTLANGAVTEASIAQPMEAAGRPTGLLAKLQRLFEWAGNKRTRNKTTGVVTLRNEGDTSTLESQTQSTVEPVDTQSKGV